MLAIITVSTQAGVASSASKHSRQIPPNRSSPSIQDRRLTSETCHIRASLACNIDTFLFSFFYPGRVLNRCAFVNSQRHEQNDRGVTNANVFIANKPCRFLSSVSGKGLCKITLSLGARAEGLLATQSPREATALKHTQTPLRVFFPKLICTSLKLTSASPKKYFAVKRI